MEELELKKKLKKKKAQSSIEFLVLFTFILIFFTVFTIFIQARIAEAKEARNKDTVNELKEIVFNEIAIAEIMPINFTRNFTLPPTLEGNSYTINIYDGIELVISYKNTEYVFFFGRNLSADSNLTNRKNTISKYLQNSKIVYNLSY